MELTGKCIAVLPMRSGVSQKNGNPWASQEYVIEVPGQYPKRMVFTVFGEERIKQFNLREGMQANVSFDIDAHEHNGRWYNSITAYKVIDMEPQILSQQQLAQRPENDPAYSVPSSPAPSNNSDDLPF